MYASFVRLLLPLAGLALACQSTGEPSFHLEPARDVLELPPGGQISSYIQIRRAPGFTGRVRLTFEDLPPGLAQAWTIDSANGDQSLRLEADATVAPGTYTLNLVGASDGPDGASAPSIPLELVVPAASAPSSPFTIAASPSLVEVAQGRARRLRIETRRGHAEPGAIALGIEGAPAGIGVSFDQNPVTMGQSVDAQVFVAAGVAPGDYAFQLTGQSGNVTARADLLVTVRPAEDFTFELVLTPPARFLIAGTSAQATIATVQRIAGFDLPVTIHAEDLPAGVDALLGTTGATSCTVDTGICFVTLAIAEDVPVGTYTLTLRGDAGGQTATAPFELEVLSGDDLPDPANAGESALDLSFGDGHGFASLPDFAPLDGPFVLPGGVFLVGGIRQSVRVLALFRPDGAPDPGFGDGGFVPGPGFRVTAAALRPDGGITVAGNFDLCAGDPAGCGSAAGAARYLATGALDPSFADGGIFQAALPPLFGVFPATGNRTLLVARGELVRLTEGGNLDPDFDGDGRAPVAMDLTDGAAAVLDGSGRILAAGRAQGGIRLARFSTSGVLDPHFDGDGRALVPGITVGNPAGLLTLDSHGRILVAGAGQAGSLCCSGFAVARLGPSGSLDTTFAGDGVAVVPIAGTDIGAALAVREDGSLLVVGTTTNNVSTADYAALRLRDDGSLDTTFAAGGRFHAGFLRPIAGGFLVPLEERFLTAVSVGRGRVLAIGQSGLDAHLTMARFLP